MKLPRDVSGTALAQVLCKHFGYVAVHQTGSHVVLDTEEPSHQRVSIPAHPTLRVGTLNAILRSVSRHKGIERETILERL